MLTPFVGWSEEQTAAVWWTRLKLLCYSLSVGEERYLQPQSLLNATERLPFVLICMEIWSIVCG